MKTKASMSVPTGAFRPVDRETADEFHDRLRGEEAAYRDLKIMRKRETILADALMEIKDRRKDIGAAEIQRVVRNAFDKIVKLRIGSYRGVDGQ